MRSIPRVVLLLAAVLLPIIAVLASYALTAGPRTPDVPRAVQVEGPVGAAPTRQPTTSPGAPAGAAPVTPGAPHRTGTSTSPGIPKSPSTGPATPPGDGPATQLPPPAPDDDDDDHDDED